MTKNKKAGAMTRFVDGRSLGIAVLIFLSSSVVGFIYNSVYPNGIPLIRKKIQVGDTLTTNTVPEPPDTHHVSAVIGLEETYEYFKSGGVVLLDARPRANFEDERISGAISLPEPEFDLVYPSVSQLLTPETHLIVYCQGEDCDESFIVQQKLVEMGYHWVDVFLGGMPEWVDAGYPVEIGSIEE